MIRKALIPMAGLGTRMGPLGRAVPKSLFPLIDPAGRLKPIVQFVIDEARSCGVEQIGLIVAPGHVDLLRKYFTAVRKVTTGGPTDWIDAIVYINQPAPAGFGEAVARGADFIGDEPFLLLLGDHVYHADAGQPSCTKQTVQAFERHNPMAMIGVQEVSREQISMVGVCAGDVLDGRTYRCRAIVEKPDLQTAQQTLCTPGLPAGRFLAHNGIYVFTPDIFQYLTRLALEDRPMGQEMQLTDAQILLLGQNPDRYLLHLVAGSAYDTGTPAVYLNALEALRPR